MNFVSEILFEVLNNNSRTISKYVNYGNLAKLSKVEKYRVLLAALLRNNIEVTKILLELDVPMTIRESDNDRSNTPLHLAIYQMQNIKIVEVMLSKGASVNVRNKLGETPLHLACKIMSVDLVNILLRYNVNVKINTDVGETPLYCLVQQCQSKKQIKVLQMEKITKILLDLGVDVNFTPADRLSVLLMSTSAGLDGMVKILLECGANVNVIDNDMFTPLHHAVKRLTIGTIKMMLQSGADPNAKSKNGSTPLMEACRCRNLEATILLIEYGANVNCSMNSDLTTPLYSATINRDVELVAVLLKAGADPHVIVKDGTTPFFWARRLIEIIDDFDIVTCYLQYCPDIDIDSQNLRGNTILHMACIVNNFEAVKQLVEIGASINIKNNGGNNPLHYLDFAEEELKKMKTIAISSYSSVYDLIIDENKMSAYAKNELLTAMLDSFKWRLQFPILGEIVKSLYQRGVLRRNILECAQSKLPLLINCHLPNLCLESIFQHFSNKDLRAFVHSANVLMS